MTNTQGVLPSSTMMRPVPMAPNMSMIPPVSVSASALVSSATASISGVAKDTLVTSSKVVNLVDPKSKNPFTDTLARYTGYFNEMTAAANTILQDTVNQLTKFSPKYHGVADTLDALADQVVLAYCGMDAGYAGAKAYYGTKERLKDKPKQKEIATARGIQAATKQFIFQFFASFYLPALVIRKVIRPTGETLGGKLMHQVLQQSPQHAQKVLPRMTLEVMKPMTEEAFAQLKSQALPGQIFKPLREVLHPGEVAKVVGYQTRFTKYSKEALQQAQALLQKTHTLPRSSMAGFLAGMASIPILVKLIDPVVHHAVKWLIEAPSNALIEKRWGDTPPPVAPHH
jgi:hypothetical protein